MKKIMLALAVAVLAAAANAASFKWTAANVYGADGNKFAGEVTLMAYAVGDTAADAFVATTFTPTTAGSISTTFSNDNLVGGTYYNFFFVAEQIVDGETYVFTSAEKQNIQAQATSTPSILFGNQATATQAAGAWATAAVPEPTSGLLLLLGVAGLALRRK